MPQVTAIPWSLVAKRLALAAGGVLLGSLCLEIGLRAMMIYDRNYVDQLLVRQSPPTGGELNLGDMIRPNADDLIVYDLRPGVRGTFIGHPIVINSLGMRGRECAATKPSATFRVIGLGDSHMFGWGVPQEETFLAVLERRLNDEFRSRHFEVLNLAVPGYNTVQEVETLAERVDQLKPDLVVINWIENDANVPAFLFERPSLWTLKKSYLRSLIRRRRALRLGKHVMPLDGFLVPFDPKSEQFSMPDEEVPDRYRPLVGWNNMITALQRLGEIARRHRASVVLLFDWIDYSQRLLHRAKSVASLPAEQVARVGAAQGFIIVDPQDRIVDFLERRGLDSSALWLSPADGHPNALRHVLLAEELLETLKWNRLTGGTAATGFGIGLERSQAPDAN